MKVSCRSWRAQKRQVETSLCAAQHSLHLQLQSRIQPCSSRCHSLSRDSIAEQRIIKMCGLLQGAAVLSEAVGMHASLRLLDLSGCNIAAYGVQAMAEAVAQNQGLHTLVLEDCQVTAAHREKTTLELARMLEANSSLRHLYLGKHGLCDSDLELLVDCGLAKNCTLELLDLRANRLSPMCSPSIVRMLAGGRSLTSVNLSCNRIGDAGCAVLAQALESSSLAEIDLRNCNISDPVLAGLAQALLSAPSVRKARVWGNAFGPAASAAWKHLITSCEGKRQLDLDVAVYTVDGTDMIAQHGADGG